MKGVILAGLLALVMVGCNIVTKSNDYGVYNIGVCGDEAFMASNVDVEKDTFTILASEMAPGQAKAQSNKPIVFKFSKVVDGKRVYILVINGHEDEIAVTAQNGVVSGTFSVNNKELAVIHGAKGSLDKIDEVGQAEAQSCYDRNNR
jgi:hypothetical protein